jgi:hypothetical protein
VRVKDALGKVTERGKVIHPFRRGKIPTLRACVAGRRLAMGIFDGVLVEWELRFYCRGYFSDDDGGPFNDVKYSLGLFNGEPSYSTGSEDIEIRG